MRENRMDRGADRSRKELRHSSRIIPCRPSQGVAALSQDSTGRQSLVPSWVLPRAHSPVLLGHEWPTETPSPNEATWLSSGDPRYSFPFLTLSHKVLTIPHLLDESRLSLPGRRTQMHMELPTSMIPLGKGDTSLFSEKSMPKSSSSVSLTSNRAFYYPYLVVTYAVFWVESGVRVKLGLSCPTWGPPATCGY